MSSIPTVEEFLEVCSEGGLEITWTDARDYLEEVTKRAEWLRVTAIPGGATTLDGTEVDFASATLTGIEPIKPPS